MTKWEYKVVSLPNNSPGIPDAKVAHEQVLGQLGSEGWELIAVADFGNPGDPHAFHAYVKRSIE